jgi:hypothetical protein
LFEITSSVSRGNQSLLSYTDPHGPEVRIGPTAASLSAKTKQQFTFDVVSSMPSIEFHDSRDVIDDTQFDSIVERRSSTPNSQETNDDVVESRQRLPVGDIRDEIDEMELVELSKVEQDDYDQHDSVTEEIEILYHQYNDNYVDDETVQNSEPRIVQDISESDLDEQVPPIFSIDDADITDTAEGDESYDGYGNGKTNSFTTSTAENNNSIVFTEEDSNSIIDDGKIFSFWNKIDQMSSSHNANIIIRSSSTNDEADVIEVNAKEQCETTCSVLAEQIVKETSFGECVSIGCAAAQELNNTDTTSLELPENLYPVEVIVPVASKTETVQLVDVSIPDTVAVIPSDIEVVKELLMIENGFSSFSNQAHDQHNCQSDESTCTDNLVEVVTPQQDSKLAGHNSDKQVFGENSDKHVDDHDSIVFGEKSDKHVDDHDSIVRGGNSDKQVEDNASIVFGENSDKHVDDNDSIVLRENSDKQVEDNDSIVLRENSDKHVDDNNSLVLREISDKHVDDNDSIVLREISDKQVEGNDPIVFGENSDKHVDDNDSLVLREYSDKHVDDNDSIVLRENSDKEVEGNDPIVFGENSDKHVDDNDSLVLRENSDKQVGELVSINAILRTLTEQSIKDVTNEQLEKFVDNRKDNAIGTDEEGKTECNMEQVDTDDFKDCPAKESFSHEDRSVMGAIKYPEGALVVDEVTVMEEFEDQTKSVPETPANNKITRDVEKDYRYLVSVEESLTGSLLVEVTEQNLSLLHTIENVKTLNSYEQSELKSNKEYRGMDLQTETCQQTDDALDAIVTCADIRTETVPIDDVEVVANDGETQMSVVLGSHINAALVSVYSDAVSDYGSIQRLERALLAELEEQMNSLSDGADRCNDQNRYEEYPKEQWINYILSKEKVELIHSRDCIESECSNVTGTGTLTSGHNDLDEAETATSSNTEELIMEGGDYDVPRSIGARIETCRKHFLPKIDSKYLYTDEVPFDEVPMEPRSILSSPAHQAPFGTVSQSTTMQEVGKVPRKTIRSNAINYSGVRSCQSGHSLNIQCPGFSSNTLFFAPRILSRTTGAGGTTTTRPRTQLRTALCRINNIDDARIIRSSDEDTFILEEDESCLSIILNETNAPSDEMLIFSSTSTHADDATISSPFCHILTFWD